MTKLDRSLATVATFLYAFTAVVGFVAVTQGQEALAAPAAIGRINVTATLVHTTGRALGPRGRQSNASEQSWRITDSHGRTIGRMLLGCRWIVVHARFCSGEVTMPRGKITIAGSSPTIFEGEYAVTGGTGAYEGGGGSMLFAAIGIRKNVLLIRITT